MKITPISLIFVIVCFVGFQPKKHDDLSGSIPARSLTGKETRSLLTEGHRINCLAFSPDGKWLAAATPDAYLYIWDVSTERLWVKFQGQLNQFTRLAFSDDGKWLASAGGHEQLILNAWDVEKRLWASSYVPPESKRSAASLVFIPGKACWATGVDGEPHGRVFFWQPRSNQLTLAFPDDKSPASEAKSAPSTIWDLACSPDGQKIAIAGTRSLIWDRSSNKVVLELAQSPALNVLFSPDGRTLVLGWERKLTFIDVQAGREKQSVKLDESFPLSFSPCGKWLLVFGVKRPERPAAVLLVSANDNRPVARLNMHGENCHYVRAAFSPKGEIMATGGEDGAVKLWKVSDVLATSQ